LQRFIEIDTNYNPNYEYESIDVGIGNFSDESSLFLDGDKLSKVKKRLTDQRDGINKLNKYEE
jgi:hypothetical protein